MAVTDFRLTLSAEAPRYGQDSDTLQITFSRHVLPMLALRSISIDEVKRALREGEILSVNAGHYVIRLNSERDGICIMADKADDLIIVRAAMRW